MNRDFEYLLNGMENASAQDEPHRHGYGDKRKAVLAYVAKLEAPRSPAQPDALELLREARNALAKAWETRPEGALGPYATLIARIDAFLRGGSGG